MQLVCLAESMRKDDLKDYLTCVDKCSRFRNLHGSLYEVLATLAHGRRLKWVHRRREEYLNCEEFAYDGSLRR